MRNVNPAERLGREDLRAIIRGQTDKHLDDMEFFETLATNRCLVMPPWVYHIGKDGHLEKVTAVRYTPDYNLDKATILLAVMEKLPQMPA